MAAVVHKKVLSARHRYTEVKKSSSVLKRGLHIPKSFSVCDPKASSLPFNELISTKPSPAWWSPNAERSACPIADLALVSRAVQQGRLPDLAYSWLGTLVRWEHHILAKKSVEGAPCFFALGPVGDSAVLLWPATEERDKTDDGDVVSGARETKRNLELGALHFIPYQL